MDDITDGIITPQIESPPHEEQLPDPLNTPELPKPDKPLNTNEEPQLPHAFNYSNITDTENRQQTAIKIQEQSTPIKKKSKTSIIGSIIFFVTLFAIGMIISFISIRLITKPNQKQPTVPNVQPSESQNMNTPSLRDQINKLYQILNAAGDQSGISITLPEDMLEPVCESKACDSYGSYMSGGTRFTVSVKNDSPAYPDFQNTVVTDITGNKFDTMIATVSGYPALDYKGEFIGTTSGGYRFTKMRGYIIKLSDNERIEINHFTPSGITVDFESDEEEFNKIVNSLKADNL